MTSIAKEARPDFFWRIGLASDVFDDEWIGPEGAVGGEVSEGMGAEAEARCFEYGDGRHWG